MTNENPTPTEPPVCERCGGSMFATSRVITNRTMSRGEVATHDARHAVWRCFRCAAEMPRSA